MVIDFHCDTLEKVIDDNVDFNSETLMVQRKYMLKNLPYIQCFASFIDPKYTVNNGGFERAKQMIDCFYKRNEFEIITNPDDLSNNSLSKIPGAILTIENGSAISSNLDNVQYFYDKGIRIMSVVWNLDNELSCGTFTKNDTGLTELGKKYIKKLEEKKIAIDVSHMPEKSFFDCIRISNNPIIATHSCVKHLNDHPRNLSDEQIKKIAKTNGLIGVCFYKEFLTNEEICSSEDIANHIDYIANLVGIDYVGLGSDFDGIPQKGLPSDVTGPDSVTNIFNQLKKKGYSQEDIDKISGNNFIRYWKEVMNG